MKTRIRIVTLRNGKQTFYPEYQESYNYPSHEPIWEAYRQYAYGAAFIVSFSREKDAKMFLDKKLGELEHSTEYIKYP